MKRLLFTAWAIAAVAVAQTAPPLSYPTFPKYVTVGALTCGVRLTTATTYQTWCFRQQGTPTNWALVYNGPNKTFTVGGVAPEGFALKGDFITWIVSQPDDGTGAIMCQVVTNGMKPYDEYQLNAP